MTNRNWEFLTHKRGSCDRVALAIKFHPRPIFTVGAWVNTKGKGNNKRFSFFSPRVVRKKTCRGGSLDCPALCSPFSNDDHTGEQRRLLLVRLRRIHRTLPSYLCEYHDSPFHRFPLSNSPHLEVTFDPPRRVDCALSCLWDTLSRSVSCSYKTCRGLEAGIPFG